MDTKKQIGAVIGLMLGAAAMYFFIYYLPGTDSSIDKKLATAASKMSENCPLYINSETRLDNVIAMPGKIMAYQYTLLNVSIEHGEGALDTNMVKEALIPGMKESISTDPGLKLMRSEECTFLYKYKDAEGAYLFSIFITPDDYQ